MTASWAANLPLKFLSLVIAGLVWLHVQTDQEYHVERTLPVSRIILRDGLVLSSRGPDSLRVVVAATGKELLMLEHEPVNVQISLGSYGSGQHVVGLSAEQLLLSGTETGATIARVLSPEFVELSIDQMSHRSLPVRALFDPLTDDGYIVGKEIQVTPPSCAAHGPKALLDSLDELLTDSIPLRGLRNSVTLTVPVHLPDPLVYRLEPDSVQVTLQILPTRTIRLDSVPLGFTHLAEAISGRIFPAYVHLDLIGPANSDRTPDGASIRATVNAQAVDSLGHAPIEVSLPDGWLVARLSPATVQVALTHKDQSK